MNRGRDAANIVNGGFEIYIDDSGYGIQTEKRDRFFEPVRKSWIAALTTYRRTKTAHLPSESIFASSHHSTGRAEPMESLTFLLPISSNASDTKVVLSRNQDSCPVLDNKKLPAGK